MKLLFTILFLFTTVAVVTDTQAQTNTVSTVSTIDKSVPSANAPSVMINQQDSCVRGFSAGVTTNVLGIAGTTVKEDIPCRLLKYSRHLYSLNLRVASITVLCINDAEIWDALYHSKTYCPYEGLLSDEALQGWKDNPHLIPAGSKVYNQIIKENEKEKVKEIEKDDSTITTRSALGLGLMLILLF